MVMDNKLQLKEIKGVMKTQDTKAASILFGVELETIIPTEAEISVGRYHGGEPVHSAPNFRGHPWMAERDGSITTKDGFMACEFVSPILQGEEGVEALCQFVGFLNEIGAEVNDSCGCHVTVNVDSVIGSTDAEKRGDFARKLAHIAKWHARAIYGQTGTGRHLNHYSAQFSEQVGDLAKQIAREQNYADKTRAAHACGRGMVNFQKLFPRGLVEFRAFAGTTNLAKVQHHVATSLGLCRRASQIKCLGGFKKNKLQESRTSTAEKAVKFLWDYLGWTGSKRDCALGLFGNLHRDFRHYRKEALRLCQKFDERYGNVAL